MTRLVQLRRVGAIALAAAGVVVACRAAAPEVAPMGPRPGPVEPSANPVPGAPDPLDPAAPRRAPSLPPDAGPGSPPVTMREIPSPVIQAAATPAQVPVDGGIDASDAAVLPPELPDAIPPDASKTLQP